MTTLICNQDTCDKLTSISNHIERLRLGLEIDVDMLWYSTYNEMLLSQVLSYKAKDMLYQVLDTKLADQCLEYSPIHIQVNNNIKEPILIND